MKNQRITNRERVKSVLASTGHRLSLDEVVELSGLTKSQVRGVANYYDNDIVPVGEGRIDLLTRAFKGRGLRVTPGKHDIRTGIVSSDELRVYLWYGRHRGDITLIDQDGAAFTVVRERTSSNGQGVVGGFADWYERTEFQEDDDVIFRCLDLKKRIFAIFRLPLEERDEEEMTQRNEQLTEIIYNMLKYTEYKCEQVFFLARKYLLRDLYLDETLPDQLTQVVPGNPYLLLLARYRRLSYFSIGIRKYFHEHREELHPVSIVKDPVLGPYGYCESCQSLMIWDKEQGWRIARKEDYPHIILDRAFFKKK